MAYIITLQEPDDLSEVVVKEEKEKVNLLSKKYLEGPLNPKPRKEEKLREEIRKIIRENIVTKNRKIIIQATLK